VTLGDWGNIAQIAQTIPLLGLFGVVYHHLNCIEPGCKWLGSRHRGHYCRKHEKVPPGNVGSLV
jgi:hypothetical protein